MTVKSCEKLEKSRVALTIEVGAEEFEAAVNKAYLRPLLRRPTGSSAVRSASPASAPARRPAR